MNLKPAGRSETTRFQPNKKVVIKMITFKEQTQVYHKRYKLNAVEAASSAKLDREMLDNKDDQHNLASVEAYNAWMDEMERLGDEQH